MANTQAFCNSAKLDILKGNTILADMDQTRAGVTKDSLKAALYETTAGDKDKDTTVYNTTGEVSGSGYTAGGIAVTNVTAPSLSTDTAIWTPSASLDFGTVTLATTFNAVLIYNDTHTTKYALSVHTFGDQTVAGNFTITMPANDVSNALVRLV